MQHAVTASRNFSKLHWKGEVSLKPSPSKFYYNLPNTAALLRITQLTWKTFDTRRKNYSNEYMNIPGK